MSSSHSSKSNGNGVNALSSSDLSFQDHFTFNDNKFSNKNNGNGNDNDYKTNGTNSVLSHTKRNGNLISSLSRPTVSNDSHVITKNSFSFLQSAAILEKANNQSDFVADFGSADIFNAAAALQMSPKNGATANGSFTSSDFDNVSSGSNVSTSNGNGSIDGDANANFADFEHNPIYNAVGTCKCSRPDYQQRIKLIRFVVGLPIPIDLKPKSSIASTTSNSSVDSMQSGDRYAALKDLDEQLRESKDKENANTHFANTSIDSGFGFGGKPQAPHMMSNPFQAAQASAMNGFAPNQFPVMFASTSPNMFGSQSAGTGMLNGAHFMTNGNSAQQQYPSAFVGAPNMNNNFQQRNPFAVRLSALIST